jgi:hypothetical protein
MPNWVWGAALVVAYLILTQWLLPTLPPEGARVAPSLGADCSERHRFRRTVTTIVQVEFRESLLSIRDEILQSLGHPVVSVLGSRAGQTFRLCG